MSGWPWSELGLPGPSEAEAVKRAYAQRLKTAHPEEDPEAFQRLHEAYRQARRLARKHPASPDPAEVPEDRTEAPPEAPEELPEEDREAPEGFDFEALFAQGDRERQEARLRRARERLDAARARREREGFFDAALDTEEAESAALAALQALDPLWDMGGPEDWTAFLHRRIFYDAQHNLDFVFALEDLLRQRPELPEEVKRRIFLAYGFYKGRPKPAYLGLYRLLLGSYRNAGRANAGYRRAVWEKKKPFVIVGAFILAMMAVTLLCQIAENRNAVPASGSADTAYSTEAGDAAPSVSSGAAGPDWVSLEVPGTHDREGEIENDVPLEGGKETSFFGMVTSYAAADYPGLYATSGRGTAENSGETFQWMQCKGQDAEMEELVMNYYLSADKKFFYCVPAGHEGETVELIRTRAWGGISIYRYVT